MASPRRVVMDTIKKFATEVRGSGYFVKRGAVDWSAFDFDSHPRAISILADEMPLFGRGDGAGFKDANLSLEMFTTLLENSSEIDDGVLDEILDDAESIINDLITAQHDGEAVVFRVHKAQVRFVESHDVTMKVQGVVVFLPISF